MMEWIYNGERERERERECGQESGRGIKGRPPAKWSNRVDEYWRDREGI